MYLLRSFQKVQRSAQTKEQESGPGRPKQDTEACQVPWCLLSQRWGCSWAGSLGFQIQTSLRGAGIVLLSFFPAWAPYGTTYRTARQKEVYKCESEPSPAWKVESRSNWGWAQSDFYKIVGHRGAGSRPKTYSDPATNQLCPGRWQSCSSLSTSHLPFLPITFSTVE